MSILTNWRATKLGAGGTVRRRLARGCDEIQGYFFGKPLPAEGFAALWRERA